MTDEYLFLFAQWGVFNTEQCRFILNQYGSFQAAWKSLTVSTLQQLNINPQKASRVIEIRERMSFEDLVKLIKNFQVKVFFIDDEQYPVPLKNTENPPPFLFVRGKLPSFHKAMAVVGTRNCTDYGKLATQKLTAELVQHGFVIVSGLAIGVDSMAHKTALENKGLTVAVLASGVDIISPAFNYRLAQNILESGGAIASAYPLGTQPQKHHFPERNFIISGLCQGTLVTEGGTNSGALITAKQAHEQGREVFAVPNHINQYALSGTNHLIRTSQAKLVENIDHILEDMNMTSHPTTYRSLDFTKEERTLLERLAQGGKTLDDLVAETTFDVPKISELILDLQLKKAVVQHGSRWVVC